MRRPTEVVSLGCLAMLALLSGVGCGADAGVGTNQDTTISGSSAGVSTNGVGPTGMTSGGAINTTGTDGSLPVTSATGAGGASSSVETSSSSGTTNTGTTASVTSSAATGAGGTLGAGGATSTTAANDSSTTGEATPSSGCGQPAETGTYQDSVMAFGLERTYHMSVPESYDPNLPQRLVFGYHGSNYTGQMMRQYLDLERPPLADGTLFVYPDGIALEGQPDHIAWELGAEDRDIAFFDALLDQLKSRFCIDESRIFVNGQSFGGLMTNAVGCIRGDVVRAIAVVAGSGPRGSECAGQVAAWLTHGVDDASVSLSSGEGSRDHWAQANGCSDMTVPGTPAACLEYQGCDPGFPVIWCPHENDGGHQHPSFGREAVRNFLASF